MNLLTEEDMSAILKAIDDDTLTELDIGCDTLHEDHDDEEEDELSLEIN